MVVLLSTLALAVPLPTAGAASDAEAGVDLDRLGTFSIPDMPHVPVGTEPIINGTPFSIDDWPETGALLVKLKLYGSLEYIASVCSSTLIAPDTVLLAAHCVDELVLRQSTGGAEIVEFGWDRQANLSSYSRGAPYNDGVAVAADTVMHPDFDVRNFNNFSSLGVSDNDDIALVFLDEPLLDVPFAYLPTAEEAEQVAEGNDVYVVGWGQRDAADPYSAGIKYGGLSYINELGDYEFQVGGVREDVRKCHGDSGGPSFMAVESNSSAEFRVVGVTSHAYDLTDCTQTGGVDTRVDAYLDWIEEEMVARCEDGSRAWCDWPGIIPPPDADGYHAWEFNPNARPNPFGPSSVDDGDEADGSSSEASGGCSTVSGSAGLVGGLVALFGLVGRRR